MILLLDVTRPRYIVSSSETRPAYRQGSYGCVDRNQMVAERGYRHCLPIRVDRPVIQVVVPILGHVLDQQFHGTCGPRPATGTCRTRPTPTCGSYVGNDPGGMQDARRHQPARARLQPIRLRKVENARCRFVQRSRQRRMSFFVVPGSETRKTCGENVLPGARSIGVER